MVIFLLMLSTSIIKNSAKKTEDEIFTVKENLRILNFELQNILLEHDYLSSAEKLLEFQVTYFDDDLVKKDIKNIKIINETMNNLTIEQFKLTDER